MDNGRIIHVGHPGEPYTNSTSESFAQQMEEGSMYPAGKCWTNIVLIGVNSFSF